MLKRLWCRIFGHALHVHQVFSPDSRRVICLCCGGDWGMNDRVQIIIPWDNELESMYRDIFHINIIKP